MFPQRLIASECFQRYIVSKVLEKISTRYFFGLSNGAKHSGLFVAREPTLFRSLKVSLVALEHLAIDLLPARPLQ